MKMGATDKNDCATESEATESEEEWPETKIESRALQTAAAASATSATTESWSNVLQLLASMPRNDNGFLSPFAMLLEQRTSASTEELVTATSCVATNKDPSEAWSARPNERPHCAVDQPLKRDMLVAEELQQLVESAAPSEVEPLSIHSITTAQRSQPMRDQFVPADPCTKADVRIEVSSMSLTEARTLTRRTSDHVDERPDVGNGAIGKQRQVLQAKRGRNTANEMAMGSVNTVNEAPACRLVVGPMASASLSAGTSVAHSSTTTTRAPSRKRAARRQTTCETFSERSSIETTLTDDNQPQVPTETNVSAEEVVSPALMMGAGECASQGTAPTKRSGGESAYQEQQKRAKAPSPISTTPVERSPRLSQPRQAKSAELINRHPGSRVRPLEGVRVHKSLVRSTQDPLATAEEIQPQPLARPSAPSYADLYESHEGKSKLAVERQTKTPPRPSRPLPLPHKKPRTQNELPTKSEALTRIASSCADKLKLQPEDRKALQQLTDPRNYGPASVALLPAHRKALLRLARPSRYGPNEGLQPELREALERIACPSHYGPVNQGLLPEHWELLQRLAQ